MTNREKYNAVVRYLMDAYANGDIEHWQFCIGMTKAAKVWQEKQHA